MGFCTDQPERVLYGVGVFTCDGGVGCWLEQLSVDCWLLKFSFLSLAGVVAGRCADPDSDGISRS